MEEINAGQKLKKIGSTFFKIQFWIITGVTLVLSYLLSLTDQVHVSISGPVLLSFFSFAYIDWEKEIKNLAPLVILILGTITFVFASQTGDVVNDSRLNIYDYCINNEVKEETFQGCVKKQMETYKKLSRFKVYQPE